MKYPGVARAYFQGLGLALKHPALIFLKWFANLACALVIVLPLLELLGADLNHSLSGRELFQQMETMYFFEFLHKFRRQISELVGAWPIVAMLFALVSLFLTGGILEVLQRQQRPSWSELFAFCGFHFGSLLLTWILAVLLFAVVVVLPIAFLEWFVLKMEWAGEWLLFWCYWSGLALILLLLGSWVLRVYDYARILVCRSADEGVRKRHTFIGTMTLFIQAIKFTNRYHVRTFSLWILFLATNLAIFPLYAFVSPLLSPNHPLGYLQEWGMGQVTILWRITAGLAALGGQMVFMRARLETEAAPPPAEPEIPVEPAHEPEPFDAERQTVDPYAETIELVSRRGPDDDEPRS